MTFGRFRLVIFFCVCVLDNAYDTKSISFFPVVLLAFSLVWFTSFWIIRSTEKEIKKCDKRNVLEFSSCICNYVRTESAIWRYFLLLLREKPFWNMVAPSCHNKISPWIGRVSTYYMHSNAYAKRYDVEVVSCSLQCVDKNVRRL